MRQNRIYITGILLLFAFLSGRAQQPRIDELECRNLKIGYEKTLHMISVSYTHLRAHET